MTARTKRGVHAELWRYRELLRSIVARDLKVKYARSSLGVIWTLLNPLVTILILVAVFSHVARIEIPQFWAFLLSGFFVWRFASQSLTGATYVLGAHAMLRRNVPFPEEMLIASSATSRLLEFLLEFAIVVVVLAVFHHQGLPQSFLLLPLLVVVQVLMVVGLMLPIATLSVFYGDVQHTVPPALLTLFYASPVFYSVDLVPEAIRPFYLLNPLAALLTLYHQILYEGRFPSPALLGGTTAAACLFVLIGYGVFRHSKPVFAEVA